MFLLDTDAVSELEKLSPDRGFVAWIESVDWLDLYLSVVTIAELWQGIVALPNGRRKQNLEAMFQMLPDRFFQRILPVDYSAALKFGEIQAAAGPLPTLDCLIGAIALTRRLTVVTRNARDMTRTGTAVLSPWTS